MCALLWRKKTVKENGLESEPKVRKMKADAEPARSILGPETIGFLPGRAWGLR
jgi:hypothetical protein